MPATGTTSKKPGAARAYLNALGDELEVRLGEVGETPTGFVRNSKKYMGISQETMNSYVRRRVQEPSIPTLVRLGIIFAQAGCKIDPFHFVRIVAEEAYKQVAPEYKTGATAKLKIETPDTIGTPAMPMQVVKDYRDLPAVDRAIAARELLHWISRDFPMFGGDRLEQIRCLVTEAVGRSNRKDFAAAIGVEDSVLKAIEDGAWSKVAIDELALQQLADRVYDPNNRLGEREFFKPLLSASDYLSRLDGSGVNTPSF